MKLHVEILEDRSVPNATPFNIDTILAQVNTPFIPPPDPYIDAILVQANKPQVPSPTPAFNINGLLDSLNQQNAQSIVDIHQFTHLTEMTPTAHSPIFYMPPPQMPTYFFLYPLSNIIILDDIPLMPVNNIDKGVKIKLEM